MSGRREADPIIRFALANMRQAQPLARRAANALRVAARALRQHPDFKRSMAASAAGKSAKDRVTLPWYLYDCINSVLDDMSFAEGAGCIADDLSRSWAACDPLAPCSENPKAPKHSVYHVSPDGKTYTAETVARFPTASPWWPCCARWRAAWWPSFSPQPAAARPADETLDCDTRRTGESTRRCTPWRTRCPRGSWVGVCQKQGRARGARGLRPGGRRGVQHDEAPPGRRGPSFPDGHAQGQRRSGLLRLRTVFRRGARQP